MLEEEGDNDEAVLEQDMALLADFSAELEIRKHVQRTEELEAKNKELSVELAVTKGKLASLRSDYQALKKVKDATEQLDEAMRHMAVLEEDNQRKTRLLEKYRHAMKIYREQLVHIRQHLQIQDEGINSQNSMTLSQESTTSSATSSVSSPAVGFAFLPPPSRPYITAQPAVPIRHITEDAGHIHTLMARRCFSSEKPVKNGTKKGRPKKSKKKQVSHSAQLTPPLLPLSAPALLGKRKESEKNMNRPEEEEREEPVFKKMRLPEKQHKFIRRPANNTEYPDAVLGQHIWDLILEHLKVCPGGFLIEDDILKPLPSSSSVVLPDLSVTLADIHTFLEFPFLPDATIPPEGDFHAWMEIIRDDQNKKWMIMRPKWMV